MTYSLNVPELDDLKFQTLVDHARKKIISYCPEWTEYNISDPGITLIELFAYMTEMLGYRLNQVPKRNYLKFLELLGTKPADPVPAHTELTFYLSAPIPFSRASGVPDMTTTIKVPKGTQVSTQRATYEDEDITFITESELAIQPIQWLYLRRDVDDNFHENYLKPQIREDLTYYIFPKPKVFYAFREKEKPVGCNEIDGYDGDAFYIGFNETNSISGYLLHLDFELRKAEGVGIDPYNPPLVWEYYRERTVGKDIRKEWVAIKPDEDTTGGLNISGYVVLHVPLDLHVLSLHGDIKAYWIRCRYCFKDKKLQGEYKESPRIVGLDIKAIGATVPAVHAVMQEGEEWESNGEPNQTFQLSQHPILELDKDLDEFLEIQELINSQLVYQPWERVDDFSSSNRYDRHYTLDVGTGEIRFGPSLRQVDGEYRQYGKVPGLNRKIRVTRYRKGGGYISLESERLQVLRHSISYISEVGNRKPVNSGQDQEPLDVAIFRVQNKLKTRQRAVTAEDYEILVVEDVLNVARAKCKTPDSKHNPASLGAVKLLIVPQVNLSTLSLDQDKDTTDDKKRALEKQNAFRPYEFISKLALKKPDDNLEEIIQTELAKYKVLGTALELEQPPYLAIKIEAVISCKVGYQFEVVQQLVKNKLHEFIRPTVPIVSEVVAQLTPSSSNNGSEPSSSTHHWEFGRNLYLSDLYAEIQTVEGVNQIIRLEMAYGDINPQMIVDNLPVIKEQIEQGQPVELEPQWISEYSMINTPPDGLLCLLNCLVVEHSV